MLLLVPYRKTPMHSRGVQVLSLSLCSIAFAPVRQTPSAPPQNIVQQGDVALLAHEALSNPGAPRMLAKLCASAPKRLSGSADAARAVEWAKETMLAIGLENVRAEACIVPHWERGIEKFSLASSGEILPVCALGGSPPTVAGGVEAEIGRAHV